MAISNCQTTVPTNCPSSSKGARKKRNPLKNNMPSELELKAQFRWEYALLIYGEPDILAWQRTNLQNVLIACAMTLIRIARWLQGEDLAQARLSAFACLYQTAAV
jgi:hypothetical protein